jgi:hypothetical protein
MTTGARASTAILVAALTAFVLIATFRRHHVSVTAEALSQTATASGEATETEARAACGTACHAFPPPDILPRAIWRDTIARMTLIAQGINVPPGPAGTAARMVRLTPEMQRVLRYYLTQAPEKLPAPTPWPTADARQFTRSAFAPPDPPPGPAVSHVRFLDLDDDKSLEIVGADMRFGLLVAGRPGEGRRLEVIGNVPHAARFELFDFDGDRIKDLMVADLGRFLPSDHTEGAVVFMRGLKRMRYSQLSLPGWPRVADVRPGDFNGDGKTDLVVGAFGWRKVGVTVVLENQVTSYDQPKFVNHVIDSRPGAIHTIPVDLNKDGRLDFIGLLAQQFETVVAYLNTGSGFTFKPETIYTAPHPNWGSSGIELVDLDQDNDLDVLLAHGDTFDDTIIKPYHGIQWLENTGTYPYVAHTLADLPGAFGIKPGDLDGDDDLDIVACAFIASGSNLDESDMPALVWLEQVKPGVFERRTLERKPPRYASLDLADVEGDGDLDILVGTFATANVDVPWMELWENRRKTGSALRRSCSTATCPEFWMPAAF